MGLVISIRMLHRKKRETHIQGGMVGAKKKDWGGENGLLVKGVTKERSKIHIETIQNSFFFWEGESQRL